MTLEFDIETEIRRLTPLEQTVLKARFGIPADDARSNPKGTRPRSPAQLRRIERRALRKLRGDPSADSGAGASAATPGPLADVESTELLNMAVFKLHDCAQRLLRLAHAAPSPVLGAKFLSIYRQLVQQEKQLQTVSHAARPVPGNSKAPPTIAITY